MRSRRNPHLAVAVTVLLLSVALAGCSQISNDRDGDGLPNSLEEDIGTDPDDPDTDGDGLTDLEEVTTYSSLGVDPLKADTDGDGLNDFEEVRRYGTRPDQVDSDQDGLTDFEEVRDHGEWDCQEQTENRTCRLVQGPDPLDPDTDDDQWPDGQEIDYWMQRFDDPLFAGDLASTADVDDDGWQDGEDGDPFSNLRLRISLAEINLTRSFGSGGANLSFLYEASSRSRQRHVGQIPVGVTQLDINMTIDVDDGPATPGEYPASAAISAFHTEDETRRFLFLDGNDTSVVPTGYNLADWTVDRSDLRTTEGQDADLTYRLATCRPDC